MVSDGRLYIVERNRGFKIPDDDPVWTRFKEWVEAAKKRESVWRTRSEKKYYDQVCIPVFLLRLIVFIDLREISQ